MNLLAARLIVVLIALGSLASGGLYMRVLAAQLSDANHQLVAAKQSIADRDQAIDRLRRDVVKKAEQQAQLDMATARVTQAVTQAHQQLRKVTNENANVRDWANTPLPDDVKRLSASPAYTGTSDYDRAVSEN